MLCDSRSDVRGIGRSLGAQHPSPATATDLLRNAHALLPLRSQSRGHRTPVKHAHAPAKFEGTRRGSPPPPSSAPARGTVVGGSPEMAERKVINKHYPDDFDPSKIPRRRRQPKNRQVVVRMMLPMTVRCAACGEYIGRETKFNSRKEDVAGERYLGAIQVLRFYIRCSAEIVFRTDPANADYAIESGATRPSYEPWPAAAARREERDDDDAMTALEDRCMDAALEEMRSLKSRRAGVTPKQLLESLHHRRRQADDAGGDREEALAELDEDDEKLINSITFGNAKGHNLRRIDDDEDHEDFFESCLARAAMATSHQAQKRPSPSPSQPPPRDAVKSLAVSKKRRPESMDQAAGPSSKTAASPSSGKTTASNGALQALCCTYDNEEEE